MTVAIITLVSSLIVLFINLGAILGLFVKMVRWVDRQNAQDQELVKIRKELAIINYGLLICLKNTIGEKDTEEAKHAITMIEKHMNESAHA